MRFLLGEDVPLDLRVRDVYAGQRDDGGFAPSWAQDYSSVDATCFRVAQAAQAGIPYTLPQTHAALAFLAGRQRIDGTWEEEPPAGAEVPPWAKAGDRRAALYLTANSGLLLATAGWEAPARRAANPLLAERDENGWLPSYLQTNWLAAGLFLRVGGADAAEPILSALVGRAADLPAGALAWMVSSLSERVPRSHPLIAQALMRIAQQQRLDGAFASGDGPEYDANTTLEALRVLGLRS